jgi:hypothetical protein
LELPTENPPGVSAAQYDPLSIASVHSGDISNIESVMVWLEGKLKPSYVELEGSRPEESGDEIGPCHVATSAAAHGVSSIRNVRMRACLIGSTTGGPSVNRFESSSIPFRFCR